MTDLYFSSFSGDYTETHPDITRWRGLFGPRARISLHDRGGMTAAPFRTVTYPGFEIPQVPAGFSMTYEEAVLERAREFMAHQDKMGLPIYLMYSGGIDSSVALLALREVMGEEFQDRVEIALTKESIEENPALYRQFIRRNYKTVSSEFFAYQFDGSRIVISGEHNDQLFGSDVLAGLLDVAGVDAFDEALKPYTRDSVVTFMRDVRGMTEDAANFWFDIVDASIKAHPQAEATRFFDFFWWLNFVYKWQNVHFRILLRVAPHQRETVSPDRFFHFFSGHDLQRWSMVNPGKKVVRRWDSYKVEAKKFIARRTKDDEYFKNKLKLGSLWRLFVANATPGGITSDMAYLPHDVDPLDYYNPDNGCIR